MYIVINNSVKMSPGKIAAQAGHVVHLVTEWMVKHRPEQWRQYTKTKIHAKIALRAKQSQMERMEEEFADREQPIWCVSIRDMGFTEVPNGTLTAIAFAPMLKKDRPKVLTKLRLL